MPQNSNYSHDRLKIRQAILRDLKLYRKAPVTLNDLKELSNEPAIRLSDPEAIEDEWNNLMDFKYIEPVPGFGGQYCRIAVAGLEQLSSEYPQTPYIWGPGAI